MILYHFTTAVAAPLIAQQGIKVGKTPLFDGTRAVSLTTVLDPAGHGLFTGRTLTTNDPEYAFPEVQVEVRKAGWGTPLILPDMTESVIQLDIPDADPNLSKFDDAFKRGFEIKYPGQGSKKLNLARALVILSASYPLGFDQAISDAEKKAFAEKIMSGANKTHKGNTWYFYLTTLPTKYITNVMHRRPDGTYA